MIHTVIFVCILVQYVSSFPEGPINKQFEIVFENPLENFPLKNMEIDFEAKNIYASGKNILYRLSMEEDLSMIKRQTGPEAYCFQLPWSHAYLKEYCGDDYNTVMVVTPDSLITCGTLRGGLCMRRDKISLNITTTSQSIRLVSKNQSSAVGIFLNISDRGSSGKFQNIVLFAKQYTTLPLAPSNLDQTAIFSVLPDLSAINLGSSKFGKIFDMILSESENAVMDYRVMIESEYFVFLLVNQNSQSKLVKICKSIDTEDPKRVYEDIPIYCNSEGTKLNQVKHGIFFSGSGKRYLVLLFSSSKPTKSAVCIFDENDIHLAFLMSRRDRYGCPKHDLPRKDEIFQADGGLKNCVTFENFNETTEPIKGLYKAFYKGDYCNDVTNHLPQFGIIVGLLPLEGNAVYTTKSHRVTVVGSLTINNLTTLCIGTDNGNVIQVFYDIEKNQTVLLPEIKVDSSEIKAVRHVNEETYVMSQNKIVKLLQTKNCGKYSKSCQQCMDIQNAHCGWCVTKGVCSTYSECSSLSSTYWLASLKNECLRLNLTVDLSRHAYKMEGKLLIMMTALNDLENLTCNVDGSNVLPSISENLYCRISPTIVFAERLPSSIINRFEVFISIVAVICVLILCVSFLFYKCGVRQGQKLDKKDYPANDADHYQSQNVNSSEENHTYEQPLPSTGHTPTGYEQELATYYVFM